VLITSMLNKGAHVFGHYNYQQLTTILICEFLWFYEIEQFICCL
jgi:hypothetical protein